MNNDFNKVVLGICVIVILCCLFIAMKYENRQDGIMNGISYKETPLQLPVKESKEYQSFERAVKTTN